MSELQLLDYLTSSLFSSYEDIEYLESLLEWGKEYLLHLLTFQTPIFIKIIIYKK